MNAILATLSALRKSDRETVLWKDVMAVNVFLQKNLGPGVKIKDTTVHARNISRKQSTSISQCSREIGGKRDKRRAKLSQILQSRSNRIGITTGSKILIESSFA